VRNLQEMMGQMKQMQEQLQQKMETVRVEASAGGGMVTVQMNGNKKVLRVKIDPQALQGADVEMLQDLVQAAVNEGIRKVDDSLKDLLGGMLPGGLKIPGLF
jgi:DNA-binding YbaB/EbfC family protein